MEKTPNLNLSLLMAAQAQKHVTHNEALSALDALVHLSVENRILTAPPSSAAEGARYLVAVGATGEWSGHENEVAAWQNGAWAFFSPRQGWLLWVADEEVLLVWEGSGWSGVGERLEQLGINADADVTNRFSVSSVASLFDHQGAGHQLKINKAASPDTASLVFQTGFSGRAELGLAGSDDFRIKVSQDGAAWVDALVIERANGLTSIVNNSSFGGYLDIAETAMPIDPPASTARLYARDVSGATRLVMRDSAGVETVLGAGGSGGGGAFRGALVKKTATQTVPNATHVRIAWEAQGYDTDAIWSPSPNPTYLVVPSGVTRVRLSANVAWSSNANGDRYFLLFKNGSLMSEYALYARDNPNSNGIFAQPGIGPVIPVNGGDYFELDLYQTSGATLSIGDHAGTWAAMEIIE